MTEDDYDDTEDGADNGMESDAYILDLEEDGGVDLDALTKEAVDAVARVESGEVAALELSEVEALEAELAELRDRSVRTLADFENFRRRSEREREDLRRYAVFEVMRDFLPILDNLGRALTASGSADDLKVGVEMILKQMEDMLRQKGVQMIEAAGEPFDPTFHEAVAREEDPEVDEPTVKEELQRGYRMHQRLLRPALVRVAMPASASGPGGKE
ncbi:MAG: nucleotide exchange factor GrpE [Thermoanaerobaculia bacterium]|nr:nucleotide exchange factor GrpE [Thermoanaerobaculia bacterium]